MIDLKQVYKLQSEYSISDGAYKDSEITFEEYMKECRIFLTRNLPEDYTKKMDVDNKQATLLNLAGQFVDKHRVKVKGYVSQEGIVNTELLLNDVCDSVTGASILKEALEDPEVDEIQINDMNTIFVARKGVLVPYVDSKGRIMQFSSNDEILIVLNKLIDDGTGNVPQFTDGLPLLNAKTAKQQYRINAVHPVLNTRDKPPNNFPVTTVVIRKFKEVKLTLDDLVKYGACSGDMARLLSLLGKAELKLFCVGPTGSGKTTLLNIVANTIPFDKRIILIQNPTEISFQERDEWGRNIRNVVHWEVKETMEGGNTKNSGSMENLISNSLRATPEVIIVGEMRASGEFYEANRGMRTGHKVLGTFHAEDAEDGMGRFANELSTVSNSTYSENLRLLADTIDIIISQFRFPNGERKVMEITEICGTDADGKPVYNKLYEFDFEGRIVKDAEGLPRVQGSFKQVGKMSKRLEKAFYKAGIDRSELAGFIEEV